MTITSTELKRNLSKYLVLSNKHDIYITKNGKVISKLSNPFKTKIDIVNSLDGIIPNTTSLEETKQERIENI